MREQSGTGASYRAEIALGIAIVLSAAGYIAGHLQDSLILRLVAKPAPVLSMAIYAAVQRSRYARTIAVGLVFGAAGDVLLEASPRAFLWGLVAFLAGHVVYVAAFVREDRRPRIKVALPVFGSAAIMLAVLWSGLGSMRIPVLMYVVVICAMLWRSAARVGSESPGVWLAVIGSALFFVSDAVLGVRKFVTPFYGSRALVLATYWSGQLLLALSARGRLRAR